MNVPCVFSSATLLIQYALYVIPLETPDLSKVASPARGQLNRENEYFPVLVCACEFALTRRVRPSRPAPACSFFILRLNLVLLPIFTTTRRGVLQGPNMRGLGRGCLFLGQRCGERGYKESDAPDAVTETLTVTVWMVSMLLFGGQTLCVVDDSSRLCVSPTRCAKYLIVFCIIVNLLNDAIMVCETPPSSLLETPSLYRADG